MINLEQVKLLEAKVEKTIDYVERLVKENAVLYQQETALQTRLESYQKRIDELEVLVVRFKEDQSQIENGILAALDRLNQFEKAFEKALEKTKKNRKHEPADESDEEQGASPANGAGTCFEIPNGEVENAEEDDIPDPLEDDQDTQANDGNPPSPDGELDIF